MKSQAIRYELGFLGAGNMAEAIARAALHHRILTPEAIAAADPSDDRRKLFASLGIAISPDNVSLIRDSRHILLAVKPQIFSTIAPTLAANLAPDHVLISIMAGITTAKIESLLARPARIVRLMPNTPLMINAGMSALCLGAHAKPGDETLALSLFSAAGKVIHVDESKMDAITALSGSGPAYLFYFAQAMEKAAADLGLADHARTLVAQTLLGSAQLLSQSPDPSAQLRRNVTSPGGTTEAAIQHLDAHNTLNTIVDAIKAAEHRGRQLGK